MDRRFVVPVLLNPSTPSITYLLGPFRFAADSGAPVTSPYTEIGAVGELTLVQTNGQFSKTGGRLITPAQTGTIDESNLSVRASQITRAAGVALVGTVRRLLSGNDGHRIGWASASDPDQNTNYLHGLIMGGGTLLAIRNRAGGQSYITLANVSLNTDYQIATILRGTGAFMCIKGGTYTDWTLLWVFSQSTANPYPFFSNMDAVGQLDDYCIAQLAGSWATDYGIATNRAESAAANATTTMTANGIIECTWTPQAGETLSILFRRTDDDNTLRLDCAQAGGTIKLYTRASGVDTEINTGKTQTWTAGNPYRIVIDCNGTTIRTHVEDTLKHNTTTAVQQTATGVKVSLAVANLVCWPKTVSMPAPLDSFVPAIDAMSEPPAGSHEFMTVGDSKTFVGAYQPIFRTNTGWYETVRVAVNGARTAGIESVIAAQLAAAYAWASPEAVFLNIGVNDVNYATFVTEAAFKSSLTNIVDAINTKYPAATIYIMRVWSRGKATEYTALNGWIGDIITLRSTFCALGPDESVYIENGDDGVTYSTDGVHPNYVGYGLTATQWEAVLPA